MISSVAKAATDIGKTVIESAKSILGIHSPSRVFEEYGSLVAQGLQIGIKKDTPKAEKESATMAKKVVKASKNEFDKAVAWINERKKLNKLSLEEELKAWEALQKKYTAGTTQRKKADAEASRVKNELMKKDYENTVNWIDERKFYDQLSLMEELQTWEAFQKKYAEGTEERKKADREVYSLKKELTDKQNQFEDEYYTKTTEVNEKLIQDIKTVNEEYEQALKSRTDVLYTAYGLFDKVESPEDPVSGSELLTNLQTQVLAFEEWRRNLEGLSTKGISEDLLKELEEMGPASLDKIKALNQLTQPELDNYVKLWKDKHEQAKTKAITELEGLRVESDKKIEELTKDANTNLEDLKGIYQKQLASLTTNTQVQLKDFNSKWETKTKELNTQTDKDFKEITTNIEKILKEPDWDGVGKDIINGIARGITANTWILTNASAAAAQQALEAAKGTLGINSPSKEFEILGKYSMEGFAGGLRRFAGMAVTEVTTVGSRAMDSLRNTIANIADIVTSNIDMNPTIRPVLDLSGITDGVGTINSLFGGRQVITASTSNSRASSIGRGMQPRISLQNERGMGSTAKDESSLRIDNLTFNVTAKDIEDIANLREKIDGLRQSRRKGV
jgi:hypothetical protein